MFMKHIWKAVLVLLLSNTVASTAFCLTVLSIVIEDCFCVKDNYKRLAETFLYIFMPALTDLEYALCDCILLRGRDTLCVCVC